MKLAFTVKSLGKKRPLLDKLDLDIDIPSRSTTQTLIKKIVEQQVEAFNLRKDDSNLIRFLKEETMVNRAKQGNVKFNEQYNREKADPVKAQETVLQAFEDGLIAFFLGDQQLERLTEEVNINNGDTITLIRLTFLAGRSW